MRGRTQEAGATLFGPSAQAAYTVTLAQQGSDVVATGNGSIDLTDLSFVFSVGVAAGVVTSTGNITTGPKLAQNDFYADADPS